MKKMKVPPNPGEILDENAFSSTRWVNLKELKTMLLEPDLKDDHLTEILTAFERLIELPFAYKVKDFIFKFRRELGEISTATKDISKPEYDLEGRSFVEHIGQRKSSVAKVKVIKPGSGEFVIRHVDNMDIECDTTYFIE